MSIKIKFRAWDSKVLPQMLSPETVATFSLEALKNERYTLMQCTGLKDKNGKEIFEGDIVKLRFYDGINGMTYEVGTIEWHEPSSAFKWFSGDPSDSNNYWLSQADEAHREVVGNKWES